MRDNRSGCAEPTASDIGGVGAPPNPPELRRSVACGASPPAGRMEQNRGPLPACLRQTQAAYPVRPRIERGPGEHASRQAKLPPGTYRASRPGAPAGLRRAKYRPPTLRGGAAPAVTHSAPSTPLTLRSPRCVRPLRFASLHSASVGPFVSGQTSSTATAPGQRDGGQKPGREHGSGQTTATQTAGVTAATATRFESRAGRSGAKPGREHGKKPDPLPCRIGRRRSAPMKQNPARISGKNAQLWQGLWFF